MLPESPLRSLQRPNRGFEPLRLRARASGPFSVQSHKPLPFDHTTAIPANNHRNVYDHRVTSFRKEF
jgi:hypothetical protein